MDWQDLLEMTQSQDISVTRVEVGEVAIEGKFELPPLAKLSMEDQVFMAAFVSVHGSIKEMERLFGISYPTVKSRLKKISEQLSDLGLLAQGKIIRDESILNRLANCEISVDVAIEELKKCSR